MWNCGLGSKLSMHLPAQLSEWQSRHRKNDKCKNGMSACHLRSIWIFAAAVIGGWRQQIEGMIRVALSLPINEGGVKRCGA